MITPATTESDVVLQARGISKSFPGVKALDNVQLTVRSGLVHALLGENGAGKSTLMNILAGVFPPDSGELIFNGVPVSFGNPREARDAGIAIIFQELNLIPHLTVAQNIFLGREPRNSLGLIDDTRMNREAAVWLEKLKLNVDPRRPVSELRVGQQQVVEIAKAVSLNARVIIMDEPTSAITEQEIAVLFDLIHQLKREGVAIIYITHKLDELPQIADEFTVFRDGRYIGSHAAAGAKRDDIIRMMVGRDLSEMYSREATKAGAELLRVESLSVRDSEHTERLLVRDVSFDLRCGEVLGIFGLMGAGRTELMEALFGLHPKLTSGNVQLDGKPARFNSPAEAIQSGLVLAPEDRKREGLMLSLDVAQNVSLPCIRKTERLGFLSSRRETALGDEYVSRLRIKTPTVRQRARDLSGGNQQKIVLAKWLATKPRVLLLDEPTRGIDVNAKEEIYSLIHELAASGLGVIMVSSELPEILAVSDRILVMCEGRKTAEFARTEANEENIMRAALPIK